MVRLSDLPEADGAHLRAKPTPVVSEDCFVTAPPLGI